MNKEKYEQLKKDINYLTAEGFVPPNKKLTLFENGEEAMLAIRNNQVPGIVWTTQDELQYQKYLKLQSLIEN